MDENSMSADEVKRRIGTAFWSDFLDYMNGKLYLNIEGQNFYFCWDVGEFIRLVKHKLVN